jgi:hypothetical protein
MKVPEYKPYIDDLIAAVMVRTKDDLANVAVDEEESE